MDLIFQKKISLQPYNTFGINVQSKQFIGVKNTEELQYVLLQKKKEKLLVMGGGSNMLLTKDFDGLTAHCLRHRFRDRLRAVECPLELIDQIGGWRSVSSIGAGYGQGYSMDAIKHHMHRCQI